MQQEVPPIWARPELDRCALFTTADLRAAGIAPSTITRQVAAGRLLRLARGVYALPGSEPTWARDLLALCLSLGDRVYASHRSAARLHGLDGVETQVLEVVSPRSLRVQRATAIVHHSTDLVPEDTVVVDGLPVTSVARTLLDLGSVVRPGVLERAVDDALCRHLTTLEELECGLRRVGRQGRDGVGALRPLVAERTGQQGFTESALEARVLALVRSAGLPEPTLQHPVRLPDGTGIRLDLAWPAVLLAVECDGLAYHLGAQQLRWDDRRQNELVLLGWTVLRVTHDDATRFEARTRALLRRAWRQVSAA